jgi:hypothetical protein
MSSGYPGAVALNKSARLFQGNAARLLSPVNAAKSLNTCIETGDKTNDKQLFI